VKPALTLPRSVLVRSKSHSQTLRVGQRPGFYMDPDATTPEFRNGSCAIFENRLPINIVDSVKSKETTYSGMYAGDLK